MAFAHGGDLYRDGWISTQSFYSNKLIDMLPRSHPLLMKIAGNNNVKAKELKGKRFVEPILARTINQVKSIRYRDQLHTSYHNLLEVIEVEPKLLYQGVTVNDKEISINDTNQICDLLSINQRAVREGFARTFAKQLYESGKPAETGDYAHVPVAMNGLPYMISENPYSTNLVVYNLMRGGTPGDEHEFWRNRAGEWIILQGSATEADMAAKQCYSPLFPSTKEQQGYALINAMTMMLLVLNGVSETAALDKIEPVVDGIFMNYKFYNLFQYARYQLLKINNVAEQKIDIGFVKLEHMGIPVYLDKNCPMNKIYFVDSSQIELLYVGGENFKQEVKEMPDAFAKRYITSFMGNYIIHKARNCGVLSLNTFNKVDTTISGTYNKLPADCNVCAADKFVDYDYPQIDSVGFDDSIESTGYSGSGVRTGASTNPPPYADAPFWNGGNDDASAPRSKSSEVKKEEPKKK
jgi:hypothetical protein